LTVPARRADLLPQTLRSLALAGFDRPRLFVDGTGDWSDWSESFPISEITIHWPPVRTAANWTLALAELYSRQPTAERFAVFQDDLITYRNLREYLERCPYPKGGYLNCYSFPQNEELANGRKGWYESNQRGRGAVALVFDRAACLTVLGSNHIWDRAADSKRGHQCIDGGVVTAITLAGGKEYVHFPSLCQHTGLQSTMGNFPHPLATSFRGETFDALELLKETACLVT
jgi:hypothetical protein